MTKEEIYERMTVQFVIPDPVIPCEFDDGRPCAELYEKSLRRSGACRGAHRPGF